MIERNSLYNEKRISNIGKKDKNSPMVSLKDTSINLLFEPFIYKNYA